MMYDGYDYLSTKQYRNVCTPSDGWRKYKGASKIKQGNGFVYLMSYDTSIASFYTPTFEGDRERVMVRNTPTLHVNHRAFEYSRTTCHHLSMFLDEFVGIDYHTLKKFVDGAALGEIEFLGVWVVVE